MLQTGHTALNRNYELVAADWDRIPAKPVVDGEGGYEGINDAMSPSGNVEPPDVRRIAYCAVFAGGAGYTYGANGLFGATSRPTDRGPRAGRSAAPRGAGRGAANAGAESSIQDEGGQRGRARGCRGRKPCKCPPAGKCSICGL